MRRALKIFSTTTMLLAGLLPLRLYAQSEFGNITGLVSDPSGGVLAAAEVVVMNIATNIKKTTNTTSGGEYNVPVLPGTYQVQVTMPGFKRHVRDNVVVTAATTLRLDATLEVGEVTESIEVIADVAQVQTENAKISTSVQNRLVDELPLVVGGALRSPFDLVTITAESRRTGSELALGGGQSRSWDATLDGVSVTTNRSADPVEIAYNAPSLEAITEFTVDTNGFKAEYGQAGGGVMTFVSKSGTNEIHGTAFNFLRNDALDAAKFFTNSNSQRKAIYRQNDFGASVGGPVWIPKIYNGKNKSFFFLAYEGFRNRAGATDIIRSVPTPEMYQGDFSKWVDAQGRLIPIYDPATTRANPNGTGSIRDPFPGNVIPQNRFSAFSKQVMAFGAKTTPNRPGLVPGTSNWVRNNFVSTGGTIEDPQTKWSLKIDHVFNDKHRLGFFTNRTQYNQRVGADGPPGLPLPLYDGSIQEFNTEAYRVTYDWTLSPRMLNHLSVGGNKFDKISLSPNVGGDFGLCFKNAVDCKVNFPAVEFTEFNTWGGVAENGTYQPLWALKDDLSYTTGKHSFKAGYAFQSQRANGFGQQDIAGRARFSFQRTSVPGATSVTSGSSFASFLLGEASFGRTETIRQVLQLYRYHGFYFQDDWRVNRRLTVNLGLRYEFTQPPVDLNDQFSDFTPDRPNPRVNNYPGALRFAGFGPGRENRRSLVPGYYGSVGPRIGIAYSPTDKMVFRSAFGRSYSKVTVVSGSGHFAGFIGQYVFEPGDNGVGSLYNWDNGLPSYPLPPQIDPSFSNNNTVDHWQLADAARAPESYYWTFSAQRQMSTNTVFEVAYNANVGAHLQTGLVNINQVPTPIWQSYVDRLGVTQAAALFNAQATSALAQSNGIVLPYPQFADPAIQSTQRTVGQALRPYPQYLAINTGAQSGDKSGHSSYHAMTIRMDRRFSEGLTFQWNYTFSKILTDSDTYNAGNGTSQDHYNRGAEKSIGQFDQTHAVKLSTLYELPWGRGRKWLNSGIASHIVGGWRVSGIQTYLSGLPVALQRNNPFGFLFNGTTRPTVASYDNWRAPIAGDQFDPAVDRFMVTSSFPTQPTAFGNVTRYNPKLRAFPTFNENVSLAKSFNFTEDFRLDFRWEMFNVFNRHIFAVPNTNLNNNAFGQVTATVGEARQMQVGLKLYW
jgi:carboxypeptidase family protein